jgi:hypothetical protein
MYVVPGRGGWAFVGIPDFSGRVYVRARLGEAPEPHEPDIRTPRAAWKVVDLLIDGEGEPLGAPFLRELPLTAIETLLNEPSVAQQLADRLTDAAVDLEVTESLSRFEIRSAERIRRKLPRPERPPTRATRRPILTRPANRALTDEFLQQLADFYIYVVAQNERPLVAIEHAANVPRNTAARWVALARKRGFLATDTSIRNRRKESHGQRRTTQRLGQSGKQ